MASFISNSRAKLKMFVEGEHLSKIRIQTGARDPHHSFLIPQYSSRGSCAKRVFVSRATLFQGIEYSPISPRNLKFRNERDTLMYNEKIKQTIKMQNSSKLNC